MEIIYIILYKEESKGSIVTDLISAIVRLLREDINGLVKTVWEALEPIKPWDKE